MRVLITGITGFVGSHMADYLLENIENSEIYATRRWRSKENNIRHFFGNERVIFLECDLLDRGSLARIIHTAKPDVVYHFAAVSDLDEANNNHLKAIEVNIMGTVNVLEAARRNDIELVINTSTSETYGSAIYTPIDELHPLQGQSPYSATKISADHLAESFYRSFETPLITIRPFNTYGPRQSARAVIPTIISQIVRGKKEIKLGNLNPTRDFSYVQDTVNGLISTLNQSCFGEVINLGSNFEISIRDTVNLIAEVMGSEVKIIEDNKRLRPPKSEVDRLWADNTKAKKLLNWSPVYYGKEGMKRGIEETVAWFKKHNNKFIKDDIYNI